jgi:hypothetical protein
MLFEINYLIFEGPQQGFGTTDHGQGALAPLLGRPLFAAAAASAELGFRISDSSDRPPLRGRLHEPVTRRARSTENQQVIATSGELLERVDRRRETIDIKDSARGKKNSRFQIPEHLRLLTVAGITEIFQFLGIPLTQVLLYVVVLAAPVPPVLATPDYPNGSRKPLGCNRILCQARQSSSSARPAIQQVGPNCGSECPASSHYMLRNLSQGNTPDW